MTSELPWEDLSKRLRVWRVVKSTAYRYGLRGLLAANLLLVAFATEHVSTEPRAALPGLLKERFSLGVAWCTLLVHVLLNVDIFAKIVVLGWSRCMEKTWRRSHPTRRPP